MSTKVQIFSFRSPMPAMVECGCESSLSVPRISSCSAYGDPAVGYAVRVMNAFERNGRICTT